MEEMIHRVYLSLGSNIDDRIHYLTEAIKQLHQQVGTVTQVSPIYQSKAWGYQSENDYLNCCIEIFTKMKPLEVLSVTQSIEQSAGRIKTAIYTDRPLDIDMLFFDDLILDLDNLKIPHPLLHQRAFVLCPLVDIAPDKVHNKLFLTINEIATSSDLSREVEHFKTLKLEAIIN